MPAASAGRLARRELVYLALAAMDACTIAPLLAPLLARVTRIGPLAVAAALLAGVLAVCYLARASLRLRAPAGVRVALLGLAVVATALLAVQRLLHPGMPLLDLRWLSAWGALDRAAPAWSTVSRDVFAFLLVAFVWWRGLVLASQRITSENVAFRFRLGVVLLAVTIALGGLVLDAPMAALVFGFFLAALTGIALARWEEVADEYRGADAHFDLGWLATLVGAALLTLLVAAAVAAILSGENVLRVLVPLWSAVQFVLGGLLYAVGLLVEGLVLLLRLLVGGIRLDNFRDELAELRAVLPQPPATTESAPATGHLALARSLGMAGGLLLIAALVALTLLRLRRQALDQQAEGRESVWDGLDLRQAWRDMLRRGRRRMKGAAARLARSRLGRAFAARTIRRVYIELGALARERGFPRAPYETPYEYLAALERAFPTSGSDLALITEAYVLVHYGEAPDDPAALRAVLAAWERLRQTVGMVRDPLVGLKAPPEGAAAPQGDA